MSDPAEDRISHGHEDHGFGNVEPFFIIADEAAVSRQPADAALDHPACEYAPNRDPPRHDCQQFEPASLVLTFAGVRTGADRDPPEELICP